MASVQNAGDIDRRIGFGNPLHNNGTYVEFTPVSSNLSKYNFAMNIGTYVQKLVY